MATRYSDLLLYAKALSAVGRHAAAKATCERALGEIDPLDGLSVRKFLLQQLALTDAALGDVVGAAQRLDQIIRQHEDHGKHRRLPVKRTGEPLEPGVALDERPVLVG